MRLPWQPNLHHCTAKDMDYARHTDQYVAVPEGSVQRLYVGSTFP